MGYVTWFYFDFHFSLSKQTQLYISLNGGNAIWCVAKRSYKRTIHVREKRTILRLQVFLFFSLCFLFFFSFVFEKTLVSEWVWRSFVLLYFYTLYGMRFMWMEQTITSQYSTASMYIFHALNQMKCCLFFLIFHIFFIICCCCFFSLPFLVPRFTLSFAISLIFLLQCHTHPTAV